MNRKTDHLSPRGQRDRANGGLLYATEQMVEGPNWHGTQGVFPDRAGLPTAARGQAQGSTAPFATSSRVDRKGRHPGLQ